MPPARLAWKLKTRSAKAMAGLCQQHMDRLTQELLGLQRLIAEQRQPEEALIRRWLQQRDPNFTAAEVEEHLPLVQQELAQL